MVSLPPPQHQGHPPPRHFSMTHNLITCPQPPSPQRIQIKPPLFCLLTGPWSPGCCPCRGSLNTLSGTPTPPTSVPTRHSTSLLEPPAPTPLSHVVMSFRQRRPHGLGKQGIFLDPSVQVKAPLVPGMHPTLQTPPVTQARSCDPAVRTRLDRMLPSLAQAVLCVVGAPFVEINKLRVISHCWAPCPARGRPQKSTPAGSQPWPTKPTGIGSYQHALRKTVPHSATDAAVRTAAPARSWTSDRDTGEACGVGSAGRKQTAGRSQNGDRDMGRCVVSLATHSHSTSNAHSELQTGPSLLFHCLKLGFSGSGIWGRKDGLTSNCLPSSGPCGKPTHDNSGNTAQADDVLHSRWRTEGQNPAWASSACMEVGGGAGGSGGQGGGGGGVRMSQGDGPAGYSAGPEGRRPRKWITSGSDDAGADADPPRPPERPSQHSQCTGHLVWEKHWYFFPWT